MSASQTEIVRLQRQKWAVLSTVVQAQVVVIGAALVAAASSGDTAGWINAGVAIVGAVFTVIGRFAAEGGLTWTKPPAQTAAVEVVSKLPPSAPPRGFVRVGLIAVVAMLGMGALWLAAIMPGCALLERREVHASAAPEVRYGNEGGRCVARVFADGHEVSTVLGPPGKLCPPVEYRP